MLRLISIFMLFAPLLTAENFFISAGGFDVNKYSDHYTFRYKEKKTEKSSHAYLSEVLRKFSPNTNSITMWITRGWKEPWYSATEVQQFVINKGYTPIFIFYWFGDDISVAFVQKHKKEYFAQLKKFAHYLKKIHGKKIVVLNPEYNMAGTEKWRGMNELFLKSYAILREDSNISIGPCVGDFGNYTKVNEPKEWKLFHPSIEEAAKSADFIAFQEMRAVTRNTPQDILQTAKRAYHFAKYLYKTYKKPTLLAYTALSSYGKDGENIQAKAYKNFVKYIPKMKKEAHLIGFGTFHYFDYPGHVGYFNAAEEYFGLLRKDGSKKEALTEYNKIY